MTRRNPDAPISQTAFLHRLTELLGAVRCGMADQPLSGQEIERRLAALPQWRRDGKALVRDFEFGSFREAISFMVRVAFEAEALNHHPEWTNVYDRVSIRLTTHHAGNVITAKDLQLAEAIERIDWTS